MKVVHLVEEMVDPLEEQSVVSMVVHSVDMTVVQ
jgi:hypothetical protein